MNKIASYLNQHLLGQVVTSRSVRNHYAVDQSPLSQTPELVVYPRNTNDIRKTMRFVWQLAEKGHSLSVTPRGSGSDKTGAAIGRYVVMPMTGYMNNIFEIDTKQKLVRLQPGVMVRSLHNALMANGLSVPSLVDVMPKVTVGGAIGNDRRGPLSGKYGSTGKFVEQLEVVLSNGDVLHTERISKRELNRRKGLATFEGEIYRQIDGLIADNQALINDRVADDELDRRGYAAISEVKRKDGSFDLTPLIIGSQGTLGIISEVIMKADFVSTGRSVAVLSYDQLDSARDAIEGIKKLAPAFLELYSAKLYDSLEERGQLSDVLKALRPDSSEGALLLVGFDEFSERTRTRKLRQLEKQAKAQHGVKVAVSTSQDAAELMTARDATFAVLVPEQANESALPLFDGFHIPLERLGLFLEGLGKLESKHHVELPLYGDLLTGVYSTRPILQLGKVGDKQKVFRLIDELEKLVTSHDGLFVAEAGEGRLKGLFADRSLDKEVLDLYKQVKNIFDPHDLLNPGVKQPGTLKDMVGSLRSSGAVDHYVDYVLPE